MLAFKFPDPCGGGPFKLGATPPTPANQLESFQYAPALNSDDEYESDNDTLSICSSVASEFSFRRRPVTITSKTPVSLIAAQMLHYHKDNTESDDDWESEGEDQGTLEDAKLVAADIPNNEEETIRQLAVSEPIENQTLDSYQETGMAHMESITRTHAPRQTGLFTFVKKAITASVKWLGNISRFCTRKQGQPTAIARNQEGDDEEEEEIDPYVMFFGNGEDN